MKPRTHIILMCITAALALHETLHTSAQQPDQAPRDRRHPGDVEAGERDQVRESRGLETRAQLFRRARLNLFAFRQQIEHVRCLRDVTEIRRQDRVERLGNQPLHISETFHYRRRFLLIDMQN